MSPRQVFIRALAKVLKEQGIQGKWPIVAEAGTATVAPLPSGPRPAVRTCREWDRFSRSVFGNPGGEAR